MTGLLVNRGNQVDGIQLGDNLTKVGKAGADSRNIISGNVRFGVYVTGNQNTLANNYIGLGADGSTLVGNKQGGVYVDLRANKTTIGGATGDLGNVISSNLGNNGPTFGNGITLASNSSETTVGANYIGTDATGKLPRGNVRDGIYITVNSTKNTIGVDGPDQLVSANTWYGIEVDGTNNTIDFNVVGLGVDFSTLANSEGWWLDASGGNTNTWGRTTSTTS